MTDRIPIPRHVAIIMDGNGRWAQARGLERAAGHVEGVAPASSRCVPPLRPLCVAAWNI